MEPFRPALTADLHCRYATAPCVYVSTTQTHYLLLAVFSLLTRVHAVSTKSPRVDAAEPLLCVLPPRIKPKGGIKPAGVVIHDALIYQSVCHLSLTPSSICLSAPSRGRDKPPKVYLMSRLPCHQVVMTTSILLFCRTHYGLHDSGSGAVNFKLCLKSCVCLYLYPFIHPVSPSLHPASPVVLCLHRSSSCRRTITDTG